VDGNIQVYEVPKRTQPFGVVWIGKIVASMRDVFGGKKKEERK